MSILDCNLGKKYSIQGMIEYITNIEKTYPDYIFTMGTTPETAVDDFLFTKIVWNQYRPGKREYYQFILTLSDKDIFDNSLPRFSQFVQTVQWLLSCWPDLQTPQFQVISAIHFDKEPIYHAHIIVNNVNSFTGTLFPWNKRGFWLLRNLINRLFIHYGFTPIADERLNERSTIPNFF